MAVITTKIEQENNKVRVSVLIDDVEATFYEYKAANNKINRAALAQTVIDRKAFKRALEETEFFLRLVDKHNPDLSGPDKITSDTVNNNGQIWTLRVISGVGNDILSEADFDVSTKLLTFHARGEDEMKIIMFIYLQQYLNKFYSLIEKL